MVENLCKIKSDPSNAGPFAESRFAEWTFRRRWFHRVGQLAEDHFTQSKFVLPKAMLTKCFYIFF